MSEFRKIGSLVEDRVANYLLAKGYTVLSRRCKTRSGELDLVALDGHTLVIFEVKYRTSTLEQAEECVSPKKIERIKLAASEYITNSDLENTNVRYDVIAVDTNGIRLYENAFW